MHDLDAASAAAAAPLPAEARVLEIRFTGSGSEYFRIWAVNLLLILVTLGLYLPFAKARRIRYFHANTLVDGQALGFHGDPWKMFRGFLLLVLLMAAYSGAGHLSSTAAFIAFLILCAVWPALWRASLQFRLGNTSWRGLRMSFEGSLRSAYLACAPVYLPTIVLVGVSQLLMHESADRAASVSGGVAGSYFVALAAVGLLAPWSLALFKRYQHGGYRIAGQHSQVDLPVGKVYGLELKTFLVALAPVFASVAIAFLGFGLARSMGAEKNQGVGVLIGTGTVLLAYLLMFAVVMPYGAARMQDLVWNRTRSEALSFRSELSFTALFLLTLKNWLLTALTLGLYRPFAAVATARMRLQAVQIETWEEPSDWVSAAATGHADATGDVAGDFFGIDMGL